MGTDTIIEIICVQGTYLTVNVYSESNSTAAVTAIMTTVDLQDSLNLGSIV